MALRIRYSAFAVRPAETGAILVADGEYFDSAAPSVVIHARRWEIPLDRFAGKTGPQVVAKLNAQLDSWGALMKALDARGAVITTALQPLVGAARNVP